MLKSKLQMIALLIALIWLSGCAAAVSSVSGCPPIRVYSQEFSKQLADELEKAGPRTVEVVSDYYVLRRQVEACRK